MKNNGQNVSQSQPTRYSSKAAMRAARRWRVVLDFEFQGDVRSPDLTDAILRGVRTKQFRLVGGECIVVTCEPF